MDQDQIKLKMRILIKRVLIAVALFVLANLVLVQQEYNRKYTIRLQNVRSQITKVQNENKTMHIRLENDYNLENLEKVAVDKLHMVYPDKIVFLQQQ